MTEIQSLKSKKIGVVGGSGFLGTSFCSILHSQGIKFVIYDIRKSEKFPENFEYLDVRNYQSVKEKLSCDIVVNLAAVHTDDARDPRAYEETNVNGAKHIVSICQEKNISKVIFTSSVAVYGFAPKNTDETGALRPFNAYGLSKLNAEKIFEEWQRSTKGSLIVIRPTVVFGPQNRGNVFNMMNQLAKKRFLLIGRGQNIKSIAFVENVTAFIYFCLELDADKEFFNFTDIPDLPTQQLAEIINKKLGNSNKIMSVPYTFGLFVGYVYDLISFFTKTKYLISTIRVTKFVKNTQFNSQKARRFGFSSPFSLEEGIEKTIKEEFLKNS